MLIVQSYEVLEWIEIIRVVMETLMSGQVRREEWMTGRNECARLCTAHAWKNWLSPFGSLTPYESFLVRAFLNAPPLLKYSSCLPLCNTDWPSPLKCHAAMAMPAAFSWSKSKQNRKITVLHDIFVVKTHVTVLHCIFQRSNASILHKFDT